MRTKEREIKEIYGNTSGTIEARLIDINNPNYNKGNYYYKCDVVDLATGLVEQKFIQYSNLRSGNFGVDTRTDLEKKIDTFLSDRYSGMWDRKKYCKSYEAVEILFVDVTDFKNWGRCFLKNNPQIIDRFDLKTLTTDKDLVSFLKYGYVKKEYSRDTVIFISQTDNLKVRDIIRDKFMADAEKEEKLRDILYFYGYER